ncbi:MoaD/ThiS family protein [archaeon]|nr:MoaD/ThiS family protein [archaeon]
MVSVKFFAGLRERVGTSEIKLDISDVTLEELIGILDEKTPGIKELIESGATIALNRSVAKLTDVVKDKDVVAIFPPVSGG